MKYKYITTTLSSYDNLLRLYLYVISPFKSTNKKDIAVFAYNYELCLPQKHNYTDITSYYIGMCNVFNKYKHVFRRCVKRCFVFYYIS